MEREVDLLFVTCYFQSEFSLYILVFRHQFSLVWVKLCTCNNWSIAHVNKQTDKKLFPPPYYYVLPYKIVYVVISRSFCNLSISYFMTTFSVDKIGQGCLECIGCVIPCVHEMSEALRVLCPWRQAVNYDMIIVWAIIIYLPDWCNMSYSRIMPTIYFRIYNVGYIYLLSISLTKTFNQN